MHTSKLKLSSYTRDTKNVIKGRYNALVLKSTLPRVNVGLVYNGSARHYTVSILSLEQLIKIFSLA